MARVFKADEDDQEIINRMAQDIVKLGRRHLGHMKGDDFVNSAMFQTALILTAGIITGNNIIESGQPWTDEMDATFKLAMHANFKAGIDCVLLQVQDMMETASLGTMQ